MKRIIALILIVVTLFTLTISSALAGDLGSYSGMPAGIRSSVIVIGGAMDLLTNRGRKAGVYHGSIACLN